MYRLFHFSSLKLALVFDVKDKIYNKNGINFKSLIHLKSIGLINTLLANYEPMFNYSYSMHVLCSRYLTNIPLCIVNKAMYMTYDIPVAVEHTRYIHFVLCMISIIRLLSQKKIKNKMLTDDVVLLVLG
jgi:hypothetical protein